MNRESASESSELQRRYSAALRQHLAKGSKASQQAAGKLGRQAVTAGLNSSALAKMHKHALMTLVPPGESSRTSDGKIARAATFFIAALTPLDKTLRAAVQRNGRLNRLQETMRRRTVELTSSQRQLKRELARRRTLQAALKKSMQQRAKLLKKVLRTQEHLRHLSHQVLSAQEEERKRISRELHDEIGQALTAINVKLATLKRESAISEKAFKRTINSTQRLVERSMNKVHRFARELRPPLLDDVGLIPALHAHMKAFTKRTSIAVRFKTMAAVEELDNDRRAVLYRVAQEAFANIAKHSQASMVKVDIRKDESLVRMEISDNGKSFDAKRLLRARRIERLGLLSMRERLEMVGGSFEVESEPRRGTTIRAQVPCDGGGKSRRAPYRGHGK